MLCWSDCFDDDQLAAATWARQGEGAGRLICIVGAGVVGVLRVWRFGPEQLPDPGDIAGTIAVSKEPVVADAVLALGQDMDQEPADEL